MNSGSTSLNALNWSEGSARWRIIGWYSLLAGTLLRFMSLSLWPLWCDELAVLQRTQLPLAEHLQLVSKRPPLYELFMRLWAHPGISDVGLRIPSAFFGLVATWIIWRLCRAAIGEKGAAVAAGLIALSPLHLMFSRIARSYSLAVMLAAISMYALWKIYTDGRRRWFIGYTVAALLALYTDSVMCAVVLAQNIFAFAMLWKERERLLAWIDTQLCVGVLFAPWLILSLGGAAHFATVVPDAASQLGLAPKAAYLAFAMCVGETVSPLTFWVVVPAFAGFAGAFLAGLTRCCGRVRSLALFSLTPVALVFLTGMCFAAASPKHLAVMLPALVILLAVGIVQLKPAWLGWVFAALIFSTMIVSMFNYYSGREFADASMATPWRDMAARVTDAEKPPAEVFIGWRTATDRFGSDKALFERYYHGKSHVAYLSSDSWQSEIQSAVARDAQVWLLLHRDEPRAEIEAWLREQHYTIQQFPFQFEEQTLRRVREGGPAEQYRSYLYKLYFIKGAAEGLTQ